jgi:small subunit ribosomal protein S21
VYINAQNDATRKETEQSATPASRTPRLAVEYRLWQEAVSMKVLFLPRMGRWSLAEVHIQDGETLENALRRFKRKVLQEDIIREVKRHAFYLKPGQKKRIKSILARKRNRKKRTRDSALEQNQH